MKEQYLDTADAEAMDLARQERALERALADRAALRELLRSAADHRSEAWLRGADEVELAQRAQILGLLLGRTAEAELRVSRLKLDCERIKQAAR